MSVPRRLRVDAKVRSTCGGALGLLAITGDDEVAVREREEAEDVATRVLGESEEFALVLFALRASIA